MTINKIDTKKEVLKDTFKRNTITLMMFQKEKNKNLHCNNKQSLQDTAMNFMSGS